MTKKRINIKDVINEEFYQLPKLFFWDKTYRENTSHGAKLLYMLVRDRFNLSVYTTKEQAKKQLSPTYTDKNGDIYCILDNSEIEFTLNISNKTVGKWMDELIAVDLVETVETDGEANRIYLNTLDSSGVTLATFLGERDYFKHVKSRKKKGKKPSKTEDEYIMDWEKKFAHSYPQNPQPTEPENEGGGKTPPPGGVEIPTPGDAEIPPLGGAETTTPGVEKVHTKENYSSDLDLNPNYNNQNKSNNTNSSSKDLENNKGLEEEITRRSIITVQDNYHLLNVIPELLEICKDLRAVNVIKKALMEAKIESFLVHDLYSAIGRHAINVHEYQVSGKTIRYEPAFFANNLVDTIRYNQAERQKEKEREIKHGQDMPQEETIAAIPLYNWIENQF